MTSLPQPIHNGGHALRVALYARVSTDEQAKEGYGLAYQQEQMRVFAEGRNYTIVEAVTEPGVSRTEFNRPGLDRVRELAKAERIDAVLAWKRDRYFGDPALRAVFEREMEMYGVRLLAMDDSGGDRPEDRFSDGIKDLLAQLEVAKTRERTVAGTRQKINEGKVIVGGQANYGFKPNATRDQYEIDEDEALIVRRIFRMVGHEGRSIRSIRDMLNDEGISSPAGGLWNRARIRQIIFDDCYNPHTPAELGVLGVAAKVLSGLDPDGLYGVWYYNRNAIKKWRDPLTFQIHTKAVKKPRSEWLAVPVPDIGVGRETVEAARERIEGNVRPTRAGGRVWELDAGILRCAACGRRMVARNVPSKDKMRHYYVCAGYPDKRDRCPAIRYHRAEKLEAEVVERLRAWFADPDAITAHIAERLEQARSRLVAGDPERQVKVLSDRLLKIVTIRENYRLQQAEDLMTIDELRAKLLDLDEQETAVKRELDRTLDSHNHMSRLEEDAKLALDFYAACASMGLENLEPEQRRDVYRRLGLRVTVGKDGSMEIEGEPKANWLPEGEIEPTEEAKRLEQVFSTALQDGKRGRGHLHGR